MLFNVLLLGAIEADGLEDGRRIVLVGKERAHMPADASCAPATIIKGLFERCRWLIARERLKAVQVILTPFGCNMLDPLAANQIRRRRVEQAGICPAHERFGCVWQEPVHEQSGTPKKVVGKGRFEGVGRIE
mgnify:CR=1 FL=1